MWTKISPQFFVVYGILELRLPDVTGRSTWMQQNSTYYKKYSQCVEDSDILVLQPAAGRPSYFAAQLTMKK